MQKLLFFCKTYNNVHGVHGVPRGARGALGSWSMKEFRYEKKTQDLGMNFRKCKNAGNNFGKMQKRSGYAPSA